jgi:hypothetical protein
MADEKQREIMGIDDVLGVAQRVPVLVTGFTPYDYIDKNGNPRVGKSLCVGVASLEPGAPHQGFVVYSDVMAEGDEALGVTTAPAFYTAVVTTKKAYGKLQQFFAEFKLLARVEAAGLGPRKA